MNQKKEIQITILENKPNGNSHEKFLQILRSVSPGTHLRTGLENIVKAGKGAIIVVGNESLPRIMDGGFKINAKFTPQRLLELAKMDGAIILSKDMKKITHANVHLTPDPSIKSNETGTRHKAAERTAKMIDTLTIAISERKNEISLFYRKIKYPLKNTNEVLRKANEQIQILEKQRELFDKHAEELNKLELRNYPNLPKAINLIQKGKLINKMSDELKRSILELGNEGTLLKTRLKELLFGVEKETNLVIKDYTKIDQKKTNLILDTLSYEEITDQENIMKSLAYEKIKNPSNIKGWRILSKTSLQEQEIASLIKTLETLGKTINSNLNIYNPILGTDKASSFKEEIEKIKLDY